MTDVLLKRENADTSTQGEHHIQTEAEIGVKQVTGKPPGSGDRMGADSLP